jgi:hypothetical protein
MTPSESARNAANARWSKPNPVMPIPRTDLRKVAARESGLRKYQGNPCTHGHDGLRYVASGQCVVCVNEHNERRVK